MVSPVGFVLVGFLFFSEFLRTKEKGRQFTFVVDDAGGDAD